MDESALYTPELVVEQRETPCARLIGVAGSGKTYTLRERCAADSSYGMLTSTTGISAVNLGAVTLNSKLSYFDARSMRDSYLSGRITRLLHLIALTHRWLVVEEYSMLDADQLDILYRAATEANRYRDVTTPLGILLVGDVAQLPPVKARWCFDAVYWSKFAANTERLTKVWRQSAGPFLDILNHVRMGEGGPAAEILHSLHVKSHTSVHTEFDGTTILPRNAMVNRYNALALARLPGESFTIPSRRWGQQRSEWGENKRSHEWGIPLEVELKIGAYVMLLANGGDLEWANGDCGHIVDRSSNCVTVHLLRTDEDVTIYPITRDVSHDEEPANWPPDAPVISRADDDGSYRPFPHRRMLQRKYVTGQVEFLPMRAAWASTVHKSQSLTLDRVQCDIRDEFFGAPAMVYVAMSRCRTLDGLRLVGQPDQFVKRCKVDARVLPWI